MTSTTPAGTVRAWLTAVNEGNAGRLAELSSPEIELIGPRGPARGTSVLREWLARANVPLQSKRFFARDGAVVVEQHATWRAPETGETVGTGEIASRFVVTDGRVAAYERCDHLAAALARAGLTEADEVQAT